LGVGSAPWAKAAGKAELAGSQILIPKIMVAMARQTTILHSVWPDHGLLIPCCPSAAFGGLT
jgi:hypothetical protein